MSAVKRFFVKSIGEEPCLEGEEFEHAKNVLRLSVGDEVILLDNSGKEYSAVIAAVEKRRMRLNVLKENEGDREAATEVALLFGYLKNADKNEFIVQKAVELGVKKLIAFSSEFSSECCGLSLHPNYRWDEGTGFQVGLLKLDRRTLLNLSTNILNRREIGFVVIKVESQSLREIRTKHSA